MLSTMLFIYVVIVKIVFFTLAVLSVLSILFTPIIYNCFYIYKQKAVYSVNLHLNIKNLILMNICLVILISDCLLLFQ